MLRLRQERCLRLDRPGARLEDERGRWIFSPSHREAQSELALTGIASGSLTNVIIDRTFVDEKGTRWVIDFKTSEPGEGERLADFLQQEAETARRLGFIGKSAIHPTCSSICGG